MLGLINYILIFFLVIAIWYSFKRTVSNIFNQQDELQNSLKIAGVLLLKLDSEYNIIEANEMFSQKTGYFLENKDEIKLNFQELLIVDDDNKYSAFFDKLKTKGRGKKSMKMKVAAGGFIFVEWNASLTKESNAQYTFIGMDISELQNASFQIEELNRESSHNQQKIMELTDDNKRNGEYILDGEEELEKSEMRRIFIMESIDIGMWEYDLYTKVTYLSEKCLSILGLNPADAFSEHKNSVLDAFGDDYYQFLFELYSLLEKKSTEFNIIFHYDENKPNSSWLKLSGTIHLDDQKNILQVVGCLQDITNAKEYENKIEKLAFYDPLTGLLNRTGFEQQVSRIIGDEYKKKAALACLDIDDFKYINDAFGHTFGDRVLKEVASRVAVNSEGFIISRFSGDELAVFIPDYYNVNHLRAYLSSLLEALNITYNDEEINYRISASIGVALYPRHGTDFEELLKSADIAMHEAKASGKAKHVIFNIEMRMHVQERILLEKDLKRALNYNDDLKLYLQPQYTIETGELHGFEALTRWFNDSRGFVSPGVFIPLAEETRLIIPLGKWVLLEACKVIKSLQEKGYDHIKIAANLSPVQLLDDTLMDFILELFEKLLIPPSSLEIEITENMLMESFEVNIKKLETLKSLGVTIALDDFGTGYSSLTYLKLLPMSVLKIDKAFIDNITGSEIDRMIIKEIIQLSHILNFVTIAEGVEYVEQLEYLSYFGCDIIQGYLCGKPMPTEDIYGILHKKMQE